MARMTTPLGSSVEVSDENAKALASMGYQPAKDDGKTAPKTARTTTKAKADADDADNTK